jgi:hypothetical protein
MNTIHKIAINIETNNIKWKIMILEKRTNKFEFTMNEMSYSSRAPSLTSIHDEAAQHVDQQKKP